MIDRRWRGPALLLSASAITVAAIGLLLDAYQVAAAFLVAYVAVTSVILGVLAMVMIAFLTTATWFAAVVNHAERVLSALPALAVLSAILLPSVLVLQPEIDAADHARRIYMNPVFLVGRTTVYWLAWLAIAEALRMAFRIQRESDVSRASRRARIISSGGLVVLGFTMTFASFDWMMSLTGRWYSTIYGVYWFAGGMTGAIALMAMVARTSVPEAERTPSVQALGKLMLTFVMFWIYIGFSQYIVIWSANIPLEVRWYVPRARGAWGAVALALLIAGGVVFLSLLRRSVRTRDTIVAALAGLLLVIHYVDTYWILLPGMMPVTWWLIALSAAMLVLVTGCAVLVATMRSRDHRVGAATS